jgi:hypothetical protein
LWLTQGEEKKLVVKILKAKEKETHLVTPPIEEAHDRPFVADLFDD